MNGRGEKGGRGEGEGEREHSERHVDKGGGSEGKLGGVRGREE